MKQHDYSEEPHEPPAERASAASDSPEDKADPEQATAGQAYLTKGQKKKLKQKERNRTKKQGMQEEPQRDQLTGEAPAAAHWHRSSEWLAGIRKQPLQVRLDLMLWTRRA